MIDPNMDHGIFAGMMNDLGVQRNDELPMDDTHHRDAGRVGRPAIRPRQPPTGGTKASAGWGNLAKNGIDDQEADSVRGLDSLGGGRFNAHAQARAGNFLEKQVNDVTRNARSGVVNASTAAVATTSLGGLARQGVPVKVFVNSKATASSTAPGTQSNARPQKASQPVSQAPKAQSVPTSRPTTSVNAQPRQPRQQQKQAPPHLAKPLTAQPIQPVQSAQPQQQPQQSQQQQKHPPPHLAKPQTAKPIQAVQSAQPQPAGSQQARQQPGSDNNPLTSVPRPPSQSASVFGTPSVSAWAPPAQKESEAPAHSSEPPTAGSDVSRRSQPLSSFAQARPEQAQAASPSKREVQKITRTVPTAGRPKKLFELTHGCQTIVANGQNATMSPTSANASLLIYEVNGENKAGFKLALSKNKKVIKHNVDAVLECGQSETTLTMMVKDVVDDKVTYKLDFGLEDVAKEFFKKYWIIQTLMELSSFATENKKAIRNFLQEPVLRVEIGDQVIEKKLTFNLMEDELKLLAEDYGCSYDSMNESVSSVLKVIFLKALLSKPRMATRS